MQLLAEEDVVNVYKALVRGRRENWDSTPATSAEKAPKRTFSMFHSRRLRSPTAAAVEQQQQQQQQQQNQTLPAKYANIVAMLNPIWYEIRQIRESVQVILQDYQEPEIARNDWILAVFLLERFCLMLCIFLLCLITGAFFS